MRQRTREWQKGKGEKREIAKKIKMDKIINKNIVMAERAETGERRKGSRTQKRRKEGALYREENLQCSELIMFTLPAFGSRKGCVFFFKKNR